jgi:trk system potassium uptake protein TrkH
MRYPNYLRQRYRIMLGYMGGIGAITGLLMLVPLLILPFYPEEIIHADSFWMVGLPLFLASTLVWRWMKPKESPNLSFQEGSVIVLITWMVAILVGTIPFMAISELSFSQAIFEATSGWTTTGLSVVDVGEAPRIILFFRSVLQLAGGAGFAIIALSAIAGSFSMGLVGAEGRGDQLAPHVKQSANIVLRIYGGYVVLGIGALYLAGMNWFDAINHAFTALATGGFSTRPESIGYWDSALIEAVIIVLMLLGATNFGIAYAFLRGRIRVGLRNGELRSMGITLLLGIGLLFLFVTMSAYPTLEQSVRVAVFEATSALTGTGFAVVTYSSWHPFGWLVLILLMTLGGGTGSTAGGIKQLRVYILYKALVWEIRKAFLPAHTLNEPAIWQGENRVLLSDTRVRQTAVFVTLYAVIFLIGSSIMMLHGYAMQDSLFEVASALGTVGLSVGVTSPDMPVALLWTQSIAMFLGRLEILTVIIGGLRIISNMWALIRGTQG